MRSLTIGMISPDFVPLWSGVGSYTIELLRKLPRDMEIHLITVRRKVQDEDRVLEALDEEVRRDFNDNVKIHFVSSTEDTFLFHLRFQLACMRELRRLMKQYDLDVIHSNFPLMSDIFIRLFRKIGVPTVCTVHSTIEVQAQSIRLAQMGLLKLDQSERGNMMLYLPLKICEQLYLRTVPWFITVSEFIKKELKESFSFLQDGRIRTIHHGVDTDLFSPSAGPASVLDLARDRSVVLFTGRIVSKKGVGILVQAIPEVLKAVPDALFVFAGAGDFAPYMSKLAQMGVKRNSFSYVGYVPDYFEMPKLYNLASVYVAPSLEDSLGIRIIEAMSCAKPVVASKVGGVPEVIQSWDNGILVAPRDSVELAEKIITLLEDDRLRAKLGKRARETVLTRFSSEKMARETATLYHKITSD